MLARAAGSRVDGGRCGRNRLGHEHVLLDVALADAAAPPPGRRRAPGVSIKTAQVKGVTVLTDGDGLTLYWFALDTTATSRCTGTCTAYWPPVTGDPESPGPGITGKLGIIEKARRRCTGDLQWPSSLHLCRRQRTGPGARRQPRPQRRLLVRGPRAGVRNRQVRAFTGHCCHGGREYGPLSALWRVAAVVAVARDAQGVLPGRVLYGTMSRRCCWGGINRPSLSFAGRWLGGRGSRERERRGA